jgi:regulator of cell morphogenesis and NO signaling
MTIVESSTESLNPETALAEIALRSDAHAAGLARYQLDFCCGGRKTLSQACARAGLDVRAVLAELDAEVRARAAATPVGRDWTERPLSELIDFIVETHHAFTRAAIVRITTLLTKVVGKHGDRHPELLRAAEAFAALAAEMEPHMLREERVLFPHIRAMASPGPLPAAPFGAVRNPVRTMMSEHDRAAAHLAEIYEATGGFAAPADACTSYRAVYAALAELRLDLLRHVSLENNVLFPLALVLEDVGRITPPPRPPPSFGGPAG